MNSIYECTVSHCRLKPKKNAFVYRVFMLSVDLDDLPILGNRLIGFSHNRFSLFSIYDKDHVDLGLPGGIRANLSSWLGTRGVSIPDDAAIRLITFPSVFGYGFNPVSFYYISSREGEPIQVVAEVVNTYREMKLYLMEGRRDDGIWHARVPKNFYVSPFSDPGDEFDFRLGMPEGKWRVDIDDYDADERVLVSSVQGVQRDLTSGNLVWFACKYPLLSVKIIGLIHWHALLLWIQKVPFFRKAEKPEAQTGVMRPYPNANKDSL